MRSPSLLLVVLADSGFGLYVHWPFCQAKCPYCDFNSHVAGSVDSDRWLNAYLTEMSRFHDLTGDRRLDSIFFGGGTPSLMDPRVVEGVIESAQRHWHIANNIEITLEANPTSVEAERFAAYRSAGVNRVSVGLQALNDTDLKRLGRLHTAAEGRKAYDTAVSVFDRTSFDLIYARQDQTLSHWESELTHALSFVDEHVSLYQLTIEPETAFGARHAAGGLRGLPDEDVQADMYALTQTICVEAGLPAYEISNHARPGSESRHNMIYWRGGDWVGLGPGAHGRLGLNGKRMATETPLSPSTWLDSVDLGEANRVTSFALSDTSTAEEYLMMSLRLTEGSDLRKLEDLNYRPQTQLMQELGFLRIEGDRLFLTDAGRPLLNAVLRDIMVD